jgi:hypothetical protein
MAVATFQQTSFISGQLSENIAERVDIEKRFTGAKTIQNFMPIKQGPVIRRPGTKFVAETKSSQAGTITSARLVNFEFSTDQTYTLEFGDGYIRFYLNRGRLQSDGTTKLVGADADTPFELGSPYHEFVSSVSIASGTHAAGGNKAVSLQAFDSTEGFVTFDFSVAHTVDVENIVKIEDTTSPANQVEGIFPVLTNVDSDTFTVAKATGGTSGPNNLEMPDLATITTSTAHGFSAGQYVTITSTVPLGYNVTLLVERVTSTTVFIGRIDNSGAALGSITTAGSVVGKDTGVDKLDWKQSADVLFLTHPNVAPKELQRKSNFTILSGTYSGTTGRANLVISETSDPHGFKANSPVFGNHSKVIVTGCIPTEFNGVFNIETVTENSISYTPLSAPAGAVTTVGNVDGWQIVDFENNDGPYFDENEDANFNMTTLSTTREPDSLTADNSIFTFQDVGRLFRLKDFTGTKRRWGVITWVGSDKFVLYLTRDANTQRNAQEDTGSVFWNIGSWSTGLGWPQTMGFLQGRSAFGGNRFQPQTVWVSESNLIRGFQPVDFDTGILTDDMGINVTIRDDQVNAIHWMLSTNQGLLIGTKSTEYLLEGRAKFDPITPTNTVISSQSSIGSKQFVRPVRTGENSVIFVQTAGRKMFQTIFDVDSDANRPQDITQLADDITVSGISSIAFQKEPIPIVWVNLVDGSLVGCTYEIGEDVIAWHKHPIGGTDTKVKSIATISDTSGSKPRDQLWMIVERTINSATVQFVEYITDEFETGDTLEDAIYMDSAFTYDSTATTTITGLDHLEGETVKVFADGLVQSDKTVSSGSITIASASVVQVGLTYTSTLETMPIALRQAQPDSYQKIARLEKTNVSFLNAQGVQFGLSASTLEDVPFVNATALQTVLIQDMQLKSSYERVQQLFLVNSSVFPSTIRSIEIEMEVQPIFD